LEDVRYEITASWLKKTAAPFGNQISIPPLALRPGHTYRARVRHTDATGRVSHWSNPVQFTVTSPDVSVYQAGLVISEIMYRGAGGNSDLEFVELLNVSTQPLDLTDVRFTKGIDFDFAGSAVTTLAPGARVLVVRNAAAFAAHYGLGLPVAGEYRLNDEDNLSNSGEQLKLSFGAGVGIQDFIYGVNAPWPTAADGSIFSLVLRDPFARPNHALPESWLPGSPSGTPGVADVVKYTGGSTSDADGDGLISMVEAALGLSDATFSPLSFNVTVGQDDSTWIELRMRPGAENLLLSVQISDNLSNWAPLATESVFHGAELQSDGFSTLRWQMETGLSRRRYFRLRVEKVAE
jgi:hypothetical protein